MWALFLPRLYFCMTFYKHSTYLNNLSSKSVFYQDKDIRGFEIIVQFTNKAKMLHDTKVDSYNVFHIKYSLILFNLCSTLLSVSLLHSIASLHYVQKILFYGRNMRTPKIYFLGFQNSKTYRIK